VMVAPKQSRNLIQPKLSFAFKQTQSSSVTVAAVVVAADKPVDPVEANAATPPSELPPPNVEVCSAEPPEQPSVVVSNETALPIGAPVPEILPTDVSGDEWLRQLVAARTSFDVMSSRVAQRAKAGRAGKLQKALLDVGLCTIAFHKKWFPTSQ
jgi:hypothetical protein